MAYFVPGGPLGIALGPNATRLYAADFFSDQLFVIDALLCTLKASVKVGKKPSGVAVTPDGHLVLTADRDDKQVSIIDTSSLRVVGTVGVGTRPFGITIDATGKGAYTANLASNDVTIIDIATRIQVDTVKIGWRPNGVALAVTRAFVNNQYDESVSVFDTPTLQSLGKIAIGCYPEGIEASTDANTVFVVCWEDNTLSIIDERTLDISSTLKVGNGPRAFGLFLHSARIKSQR